MPNDINERNAKNFIHSKVSELSKFHDYDFTSYKGRQRVDKIARNLVDYEAGKTIFEVAYGSYKSNNTNQLELL